MLSTMSLVSIECSCAPKLSVGMAAIKPKSGGVHRHRNTFEITARLFRRRGIGHSGEGGNQTHNRTQESKQGGNIGQHANVLRAFFLIEESPPSNLLPWCILISSRLVLLGMRAMAAGKI